MVASEIFRANWLWLVTLVAAVSGVGIAFGLHRFFRDARSRLVVPICWLGGSFVAAMVAVWSKDLPAELGGSEIFYRIAEISWVQRAIVLLAPGAGPLTSQLFSRRASARREVPPSPGENRHSAR